MQRATPFVPEEYFHVYNRGNSKQDIFLEQSDYERFKATLYLANTSQHFNVRDILESYDTVYEVKKPDTLVKIAAYCIMSNHFHLLVSPVSEGGLSKFMQKLSTSYAMYFNTKYERTGSLYEGKFKAKHADSDTYLKYLFAYVHLNPVAKKITTSGEEKRIYPANAISQAIHYPHSSLHSYLSTSPRSDLGGVDGSAFAGYFATAKDMERELLDWVQFE